MLVVGSANMDLVFETPKMPVPGETLLGGRFATHPGGKGANQAVAIARLGGSVAFCGRIGDDGFGEELWMGLRSASVGVDWLTTSRGSSGTAGIFVDAEGRNTIVVAPGANGDLTPDDVRRALSKAVPSVVLAQLEVPIAAVTAASEAPRFVLNPAPACDLPDAILARCYALTPNESELQSLTGIVPTDDEAIRRAAGVLLDRGVENVVVTLGERGSLWRSVKGEGRFAAPRVRVVDTTAAGDAFNGALALFLAEGREMANAVPLANCVGALATTRPGAQGSMPTREDLRTLAGELF